LVCSHCRRSLKPSFETSYPLSNETFAVLPSMTSACRSPTAIRAFGSPSPRAGHLKFYSDPSRCFAGKISALMMPHQCPKNAPGGPKEMIWTLPCTRALFTALDQFARVTVMQNCLREADPLGFSVPCSVCSLVGYAPDRIVVRFTNPGHYDPVAWITCNCPRRRYRSGAHCDGRATRSPARQRPLTTFALSRPRRPWHSSCKQNAPCCVSIRSL